MRVEKRGMQRGDGSGDAKKRGKMRADKGGAGWRQKLGWMGGQIGAPAIEGEQPGWERTRERRTLCAAEGGPLRGTAPSFTASRRPGPVSRAPCRPSADARPYVRLPARYIGPPEQPFCPRVS